MHSPWGFSLTKQKLIYLLFLTLELYSALQNKTLVALPTNKREVGMCNPFYTLQCFLKTNQSCKECILFSTISGLLDKGSSDAEGQLLRYPPPSKIQGDVS